MKRFTYPKPGTIVEGKFIDMSRHYLKARVDKVTSKYVHLTVNHDFPDHAWKTRYSRREFRYGLDVVRYDV